MTSNRLVADWARQAGIPVFDWPAGSKPDPGPAVFDYLFSIANLRVIPPEILARASRGAINFHDSLLPAYAGLNATSWAIMAGETNHGITWHEMTAEIDGGRILRQHSFPLTPDDTAFTVNVKCYESAAESFDAVIKDLRFVPSPFTEQKGLRRYFGRGHRPEAAATIDLGNPGDQIATLARALDFGTQQNPLGRAKLFLGDVGNSTMEEISRDTILGTGIRDFGWSNCEGTVSANGSCTGSNPPIRVYTHSSGEGSSVTGGFVYRGPIYGLQGIYIYSDYTSGRINFLRRPVPPATAWTNTLWRDTDQFLVSFGIDEAGGLYTVDIAGGRIWRFQSSQVGVLFANGFDP